MIRDNQKPIRVLTPLEELRLQSGLSDVELTDAYNLHHGTILPSPLHGKHIEGCREALYVQRRMR